MIVHARHFARNRPNFSAPASHFGFLRSAESAGYYFVHGSKWVYEGGPGRKSEEGAMSSYAADISWALADGDDFLKGRYRRAYAVSFDGGVMVPASASPHVVGKWADSTAVDPEEMLVAALSGCHMLSFLHVARLAGFAVASYRDHAEGVMEEIAPGKQAITKAVLHPKIEWADAQPDQAKLDQLHHAAHELCFIANSVRTEVTVA